MRAIFEYKRLEIPLFDANSERFCNYVQKLGKMGWELVSVQINDHLEIWYFKREECNKECNNTPIKVKVERIP